MLRIGIVGGGVIGDAHASAISSLKDQKLVAIAEPIERLRDGLAGKYSVPRAYSRWEELVEDNDVDVVYVGVPNDLHAPIAIAAMETGKHVVCEKPLARTVAEGKSMVDKCLATGRKLFIALNHRFVPSNQRVKQMLDNEAIGRPFLARSAFIGNEFARMDDPSNWKGTKEKSGGGVVIDNGTHMIDLLRWWFGDIASVSARCGRLGITAVNKEEDTAAISLEFRNGALAELSLTFAARHSAWPQGYIGAAIRTEIYGVDGSIKVGNDGPALQFVSGSSELVSLEQNEISTGMPASLQEHFADCIRGDAQPIVTVEDGLAALEIVEAAYRSAREGRCVMIEEVREQANR
ncbi:MAG: Gfo/Idh/MocA family oxidoreductase [Armatimonadetes bacterium]|nr:Gfo/Idh/MocA family oxidoreductase [Armatimonadota bacterium]